MTAPNKVHGLTAEQWERRCTGKRRWSDEMTARAAALHALETYRNTDKLWVYQCPHCKCWHLTKQKGWNEPVTIQKEKEEA